MYYDVLNTDSKLAIQIARTLKLSIHEYTIRDPMPNGSVMITFKSPQERALFNETVRQYFNRQMSTNP